MTEESAKVKAYEFEEF
jgi:hypothetical protein